MSLSRRQAREDALQVLYQLDLNQELTPEAALFHYENHFLLADIKQVDDFTRRLVSGVIRELKAVDEIIAKASENWRPDRMAAVDRNILRLGAYELHFCDDVPTTVTINEMIEVAKQFGSETSPPFINGILDKIRTTVNNPNKAP